MQKLLRNIEEAMADAALLEMGVPVARSAATDNPFCETLEENFIEVAFAEAADYDQIHGVILREHWSAYVAAHPDVCVV